MEVEMPTFVRKVNKEAGRSLARFHMSASGVGKVSTTI